MKQTPVFQQVVAAGQSRPSYRAVQHQRLDALINEWIEKEQGGYDLAVAQFCVDEPDQARAECEAYARRRYRQVYGMGSFILLAIFSGIISWLVQRTLDMLFRADPEDTNFLD